LRIIWTGRCNQRRRSRGDVVIPYASMLSDRPKQLMFTYRFLMRRRKND